LLERRALAETAGAVMDSIAEPVQGPTTALLVLMEPHRPGSARELLGAGSQLAQQMHGYVTGLPFATTLEGGASHHEKSDRSRLAAACSAGGYYGPQSEVQPVYIALAVSGHIYHTCGIQAAGTVLAVNTDPDAGIFAHADIGIVADWADCVPYLVQGLKQVLG
jgi:hypothetical protein